MKLFTKIFLVLIILAVSTRAYLMSKSYLDLFWVALALAYGISQTLKGGFDWINFQKSREAGSKTSLVRTSLFFCCIIALLIFTIMKHSHTPT